MKHSVKITIILLLTFLITQFIGLSVVYNYIDFENNEFKELPIGERPEFEQETSYLPVIVAIIIGTIFMLVLIKFKLIWVWKIWFLMALIISLWISFSAFISSMVAIVLAVIFGVWRIFKNNVYVQNLTELFVYGGLAAIFVPIFSVFSVSVLLIVISIYDMYAVWKSKHMITLAKAQTKAGVFAGLMIPYSIKKVKVAKGGKKKSVRVKSKVSKVASKVSSKVSKKVSGVRTAILGGGDLGFPLIFAGVVLKEMGLAVSLVIPFFAMAGLGYLFYIANEKKYYPAMPFIAIGCFAGLGVVWFFRLV
jgi:presenilin-like A22 family membrane protease